ncbi:unnamed protein product [Paramecium octaurelia]|uniref:Uncharacterized protein n=1 Tax=Paramecium octaurelia TaxID=43137 RepID=A0A8S1T316_PAROT|nr:unnamed protein product [Paramecium octaurelia]
MFDLNSIQETVFNTQKTMYEELIEKLYNKNIELEKQIQTLKIKCKEQSIKLQCAELNKQKVKNQIFTKVSSNSGYYIIQFKQNQLGKKKQEFQLLTKKDQIQKEVILFEQNQETEKKQKKQKELEKTPPKTIINQQKIVELDDLEKNELENQLKQDVDINRNEQQQTISKSNPSQNEQQQQSELEQIKDLNYQNEKASQKQQWQPQDHINQLKNDHTEENKQKIQHLHIQIQDLQNQNLQNEKKIIELTQLIAQLQKASPNSEDSTMIIELMEENQKEQFQNGHNKKEYAINQNHQQIDQYEKEKLLKELNEERRKNDDLIKSQHSFLQELTKIYKSTKIRKLESEDQEEEEEDDDNTVGQEKKINQQQLLKEWKKNLQQLADEIGEYEENERNLKQELQGFTLFKQKYEELTMYYTELEKQIQTLKIKCKEQSIKLQCAELNKQKVKNQIFTKVSSNSGYYIIQFKQNQLGKKKQEFQLLTKKDQIQKEVILFEQNQETEKKQKKQKELEKTPPKTIINQQKIVELDDLEKNELENQLKQDVDINRNEQQQTISKSNPSQNEQQQQSELEQIKDLNYQNEKASQKQQWQPQDHINQLKNDHTEENKQKIQHLHIQIQDLQNQNLQNEKKIIELTQLIAQLQKASPNSEDSTMIIELMEENQKEQFQNGHNKKEYAINQNHQQIDQYEKEKLLKELNEERRKNDDLIKSQHSFLQELTKIYKSTKIRKLESEDQEEEEEDDDNTVGQEKKINQQQLLKEWKKNLQQLADEIGEYEENERNLKQELQGFTLFKQKYEELTMYYTEAYNRLGQALQQIDELNQEIDNKNSLLQEYSQQRTQQQEGQIYQNQNNQFQENNENDSQSNQEIQYLKQIIQQLQAQLDEIQQQDYYQRMSQILQENDELKKINSDNLGDTQKKDQLIEELQQQLLTQSQIINKQDLLEKKNHQELQQQNDFNQLNQD